MANEELGLMAEDIEDKGLGTGEDSAWATALAQSIVVRGGGPH